MKRGSLVSMGLFLLAACAPARGFDRGAIRQIMRPAEIQVTDEEIRKVLEAKPQSPVPFSLAIHLYHHERWYPWQRPQLKEIWNTQAQEEVIKWFEPLKTEGIVSSVVLIADAAVDSGIDASGNAARPSLRAIRLAAARYHADAVLGINSAGDYELSGNPLAFFYITLVGPLFVPGSKGSALVLMNGSLWDVRNEYLYLTVEAEGAKEETGPPAWIDDKEVIRAAKDRALENFGPELQKRFRNLKG